VAREKRSKMPEVRIKILVASGKDVDRKKKIKKQRNKDEEQNS
jgi:hypothetical protein